MKIKTRELKNTALDWAVAKCEGFVEDAFVDGDGNLLSHSWQDGEDYPYRYSINWVQGGPIIEREKIDIYHDGEGGVTSCIFGGWLEHGETPLIAAMRCYVASKLGDEVEIPDMLVHVKWDRWGKS